MKQNFGLCLADTEIYEGWKRYSNDKFDPGGSTYSGITQRAFTAWLTKQGKGNRSVRHILDSEVSAIAKLQYWDTVRGDELPAGLDLLMFDISFNSGPLRAIKLLQRALGQAQDGIFGLETQGALGRKSDQRALIKSVSGLRMTFWHSLSTWWHFGKGWNARGLGIETKALLLVAPKLEN